MNYRRAIVFLILGLSLGSAGALAGVLPEDRSDILYHLYDGGGVAIDGPSVLVRKKIGKSISVTTFCRAKYSSAKAAPTTLIFT